MEILLDSAEKNSQNIRRIRGQVPIPLNWGGGRARPSTVRPAMIRDAREGWQLQIIFSNPFRGRFKRTKLALFTPFGPP